MKETYTLTATPFLFPEGEFEGELNGVTFTATSPTNTKRWFTVNCGQFGNSFANLVPRELAEEITASLTRGDEVDFPGTYENQQLKGGFDYVHNGRHVGRL
jgi:hypothetical protein